MTDFPDSTNPPPNWRDKLSQIVARLKERISGLRARGDSSAELGSDPDSAGPGMGNRLSESITRMLPSSMRNELREKVWEPLAERTQSFRPSQMAKGLPSNLDAAAWGVWAQALLKRERSAFWGRALTLFVCCFFLADLVSLWTESLIPEPPVARVNRMADVERKVRTIEEYQAIFARNLFNSRGLIPGEGPQNNTAPVEDPNAPAVKSSLPLNLIGTLILRDELRSIATIEDKGASAVYPVRAQDEIPSKARIIQVEARRVTFINTASGRKEFIELPEDEGAVSHLTIGRPTAKNDGPGIEQVAATQFNISKSEVDKAMSNFNQVLTQARCVPNFENGLPSGYKCFQIVPGSIYQKLGIQDGDVVCGINGQDLSDYTKLLGQLGELKNMSHIDMCIKRNGKQMTMAYDIH